jgi:hypothetical protein
VSIFWPAADGHWDTALTHFPACLLHSRSRQIPVREPKPQEAPWHQYIQF